MVVVGEEEVGHELEVHDLTEMVPRMMEEEEDLMLVEVRAAFPSSRAVVHGHEHDYVHAHARDCGHADVGAGVPR
jgi:hypothetical protein